MLPCVVDLLDQAVMTPLVEEYQNLNSVIFRLNGLKSPSLDVGRSGPSDSGSAWGERNPMKLFSKKMPSPYVTMYHPFTK